MAVPTFAQAPQPQRPNIVLIVSDDTGYGDLGAYGGGEGRGMPTPNIDRLANEGMTFFSFYAQPSCTPGRAAMQTGRIPNRSGMTTVAFQGQGGGLPAAEWTLGSVLKQAGYRTFFTGKWHLGEADYALPNAQGYDEMKYCGLYHLNAYTYARPDLVPGHGSGAAGDVPAGDEGRAVGQCRAAGARGVQDQRPVRQHARQGRRRDPLLRRVRREGVARLSRPGGPVARAVLHEHQLHEGAPAQHAGPGIHPQVAVQDQVRRLGRRARCPDRAHHGQDPAGRRNNTLVFYTTDNGAWQDVYPDAGYTPFRGTKGTVREGGNRVPAMAWWPGRIKPDAKNHEILGGLDLMATFASVAGTKLPERDRESQPIIFDSYDMSPVLFGTGKSPRTSWFYFTEDELTPGAARVGNYKAVFNLRGDDGASTGGLAVDTNLGWKGASKYVATVPQVFDLWQDPQERYDIFMNNYTERTWTMVTMSEAIKNLMKTYVAVSAAQAPEPGLYRPGHALRLRARADRPGDAREGGHQPADAHRQLRSSGRPRVPHAAASREVSSGTGRLRYGIRCHDPQGRLQ